MIDKEEWLQLVRDVERAQLEKNKKNPYVNDAGASSADGRRVVVPKVMPDYLAKHVEKEADEKRTVSSFKVLMLIIAVALLAGAYRFYQDQLPKPVVSAESSADSNSSKQAQFGGSSFGFAGSGGAAAYSAAIKRSLENRLRPAGYLETLLAGQKAEWLKVSSLELPKDGKPLIVYAIMYASLDEVTNQRWLDAGLLTKEVSGVTPFVHKVTLSKRDDIELLLDWHVEGVLSSLPNKAAKF